MFAHQGRLHREGCGVSSLGDFLLLTGHSSEQSVLPDLAWGGRTRWWSSVVPANLNHCQVVVCLLSAEVKGLNHPPQPLAMLLLWCPVGLLHYKGTLLPHAQLFQKESWVLFLQKCFPASWPWVCTGMWSIWYSSPDVGLLSLCWNFIKFPCSCFCSVLRISEQGTFGIWASPPSFVSPANLLQMHCPTIQVINKNVKKSWPQYWTLGYSSSN